MSRAAALRSCTVERIHALNLCHYCGICLAACPKDNIVRLEEARQGFYFHVVNEGVCGRCDLCLRICPGEELDLFRLNNSVFGRQPADEWLGNYQQCYLAAATDPDVRRAGASGGVTTALLAFCLRQGLIDGALVVADGKASIKDPRVFVARSEAELIECASSKYYPVPLMEGLDEVARAEGRYGVVGLPCHIHGLRKYELLRKTLRRKIVLQIGLFCGYSSDFASLDFLASRAGLASFAQVDWVNFRAGEWPGHVALRTKDGREVAMSRAERDLVSMLHMPTRCVTCPDQTSELADLAVGDAWLPELLGAEPRRWSAVVIARPSRGHDVLRLAEHKGAIRTREVEADKVAQSQKNLLVYKKRGMQARLRVLPLFGYGTPNFGAGWRLERSRLLDYFGALAFVAVNRLVVRPAIRRLMERLPSRAISPASRIYRHLLQPYDLRRRIVGKARVLWRRFTGRATPGPALPPLQP